ncbi:MAG: NAD+ synthase [Bacteroidota bacterium]|nr:NAD+ synthase [Bacteroidota bacterium]
MNIKEIHKFLVNFLNVEITKSGFYKAIIGISGGVDSAVSVYLAVEALGKENVFGVVLPYKTSSPISIADAQLVINTLGIRNKTIDITPMVDEFLKVDPDMSRLRLGNIAARARMIVLYDLSAKENALVIGTSNKTEILLGYGTLFGDTASAINPLGDLYKTQIWDLAKESGVPENIISKIPTADLWTGQTDEGELGFLYKDVDKLFTEMIDNQKTDVELAAAGFEKEFINKVRLRISKYEFKRRLPLIAKLPG